MSNPLHDEKCRRCGKTGFALDEFLNYWTGLCAGCHDDEMVLRTQRQRAEAEDAEKKPKTRKTLYAIMWEGDVVTHDDGGGKPSAFRDEDCALNAFSWYPKNKGYSLRECVVIPVDDFLALGGEMILNDREINAKNYLCDQIKHWADRVRRLEESGCTDNSTQVNISTAKHMVEWFSKQLAEVRCK